LYCNQICAGAAAWDGLDPAYQDAVAQAAAEAIAYVRPLMEAVDGHHRMKLADSGMEIIRYDTAFYDSVLALPGVQALYDDIDKNQTDGLASALLKSLGK
jgi:TRAP-type C4-dicarboxylate transport system substrate-binding protein